MRISLIPIFIIHALAIYFKDSAQSNSLILTKFQPKQKVNYHNHLNNPITMLPSNARTRRTLIADSNLQNPKKKKINKKKKKKKTQ